MIKLNKTKLNELLYYISTDNIKMSLIVKLIYIYGRNAREVLNLTPDNVNLTDETITYNIPTGTVTFPLLGDIMEELLGYIYDSGVNDDESIFLKENESIDAAIKKINYYLEKTIESLNTTIDFKSPRLTTKDFRILRGQHLYLDGTTLHAIHELYCNTNLMSTKDIIQYNKLNEYLFPYNNLNTIFDNTDLNLYYDYRFELTDLFTVSDGENNTIIEVDYEENIINIITEDNNLVDEIQEINPEYLFKELNKLESGNFKFINNLKIIKN